MANCRDWNVNVGSGKFEVYNIGHQHVQHLTTTADPHKRLWDVVVGVGASHNSEQQFSRGTCLKGTRVVALRDIHNWIVSAESSFPICWLSGTAGVGKLAIAMTVAKSCEHDGVIVASFFFFGPDSKRNNPSALVPTIALGLAEKIPSLRASIDQKISEHPTILEANLEDQFRELIVNPSLQMERLGYLQDSERKAPILVIIDGLDECGDEDTQLRILSIIRSSYQQSPSSWPPLKFLICSRPEAWLQEAFNAKDLRRLTRHVTLDDSLQSDQDIERYFLHQFQTIRESPKFARLPFPSPWPSKKELGQLVHKASRQFVYATTAVKLVKAPYSNPLIQLRTILDYTPKDQTSDSPFPELDRLYYIVLSANPYREKLLSVLGVIFLFSPHHSATPENIEIVLGLTPGEVDLILRGMHSVLDIQGGTDRIRVFHTSFQEYLLDRTRCSVFFIDNDAQAHPLAWRWLQALSTERIRRYSFHLLFEPSREYLYTAWIGFFVQLPSEPSQELIAELRNVELSAALLAEGHEDPIWSFNDLVWFMEQKAWKIPPDIMDRLKNPPKRFHLEFESSCDVDEVDEGQAEPYLWEAGIIVKLTGFRFWSSYFRRDDILRDPPLTFRISDCRCGSDVTDPVSIRAHEHYAAACLRTLRTLVSAPHVLDDPMIGQIVFTNLAESSLLQHCSFGPELFAVLRDFFLPLAKAPPLPLSSEKEGFRTRLLDWLDTCPEAYATEAEALKSQVLSLFESTEARSLRIKSRLESLKSERARSMDTTHSSGVELEGSEHVQHPTLLPDQPDLLRTFVLLTTCLVCYALVFGIV